MHSSENPQRGAWRHARANLIDTKPVLNPEVISKDVGERRNLEKVCW